MSRRQQRNPFAEEGIRNRVHMDPERITKSSSNIHTNSLPVAFDVVTVRRDFSALDQIVHGHPLVYLDNAATRRRNPDV